MLQLKGAVSHSEGVTHTVPWVSASKNILLDICINDLGTQSRGRQRKCADEAKRDGIINLEQARISHKRILLTLRDGESIPGSSAEQDPAAGDRDNRNSQFQFGILSAGNVWGREGLMAHVTRLMLNSVKRVKCKKLGLKNEGLIHGKEVGRRCRGHCWW